MDSIMNLIHNLDMKVVAEGIEKESQYERLKEIACDFAQGYYLYKPLEEEDVKKHLPVIDFSNR